MNKLLNDWNIGRIIRLLAGIGIGIYAVISKDYMFLLLGGLFLLQGVLNMSCCGGGSCLSSDSDNTKQVYKGEIKEYKPGK